MQPDVNRIERILVRGTNWIGDAVMATPALQRIRSSFRESHITLLAAPRITGLFEGSPFFDEIIEYRRREGGVRAFIEAVKTIRARRFDLAVLFQNAFEAALLAWLGGSRLRIGFDEQARGFLLTHKLHRGPEHRNRHQVHDYLDIVAECERVCFGHDFHSENKKPLPSLTASRSQQNAARALFQSLSLDSSSHPLIALNAGATNSRAKCWPEDRFAALAERLIKELNARIILIGAASERDYAERVMEQVKTRCAINLAGRTSMAELIGLLDACDLLVSNDTGPAHIAAALGRPTLTIFGPTNEFETAPTGSRAELIRAEGIKCARCMLRDCPIDHRCMTRISADEVFERARALLN
ncbi:MAG: lipopolysaccharide heptosyltransferase II [Acidobacteria bacterium]|nr:lipopolysaccharide heptosyltransferase II [Acidobacteriota bacterium]MCI0663943.1 lipopolysaccharide heptosyltransferase II [Acidobacteriota bacterium]